MLNCGTTAAVWRVGGARFSNVNKPSVPLQTVCVNVVAAFFNFPPPSSGSKKTDTQIPVQEQVNPETEHTVYG